MRDRPVNLDQLARARACVQLVDVLRDDGVEQAGLLELGQHLVRAVGPLVLERLKPLAIERPEPSRVPTEGVDVSDRHRIDIRPQTAAGAAKIRNPRWNRDPGPGQRYGGIGGADPLGELWRAHLP